MQGLNCACSGLCFRTVTREEVKLIYHFCQALQGCLERGLCLEAGRDKSAESQEARGWRGKQGQLNTRGTAPDMFSF